jgi:hypothetical protein
MNDDMDLLERKQMARKELARREIARRQSDQLKSPLFGTPIESNEQTANRFKGLGQGVENVGIGALNLLPGVNIEKGKWAGDSPEAKQEEMLTDVGSYALPGKAFTGALGAASKIPKIANVINSAAQGLKSRPVMNVLANILKGTGEGAASGAILSDKENQGEGAKTGGEWGLGTSLASQLLGVKNPVANALVRSILGAGAGLGVNHMAGLGQPYKSAIAGAGAGYGLPKAANMLFAPRSPGMEMLEHINPSQVSGTVKAANELNTPLTPAEASGNPFVANQEGRLLNTGKSAQEKTNILTDRKQNEVEAIKRLKNEISPGTSDASYNIREAAKGYLGDIKGIRSKAADPFYKQAEAAEIPQHELDALIGTPRIKNTLNDILNDQDYVHELGGALPTGAKMSAATEHVIDTAINKARSRPYNKANLEELNYAKKNFRKNYDDPRVQAVLKDIYRNDPITHAASMGINLRSGKVIDLAQKLIGEEAENLGKVTNPGRKRYKAGLIGASQNMLKDVADKYIAPYKKARETFASMSPEITRADESVIARIANLKDTNLHTASQIIFDPSQTNPRVLAYIRQSIMRKNPEAWDGIVRNEIERLTKQGTESGSNFFRKVLENDNQFKQFHLALDHKPEAQKTLENMKKAWKDLISLEDVKGSHFRSKEGFSQSRGKIENMIDWYNRLTGSEKNLEAVKFIHSRDWINKFGDIQKIKNKEERIAATSRMIVNLLGKSTAAVGTAKTAKSQGSD